MAESRSAERRDAAVGEGTDALSRDRRNPPTLSPAADGLETVRRRSSSVAAATPLSNPPPSGVIAALEHRIAMLSRETARLAEELPGSVRRHRSPPPAAEEGAATRDRRRTPTDAVSTVRRPDIGGMELLAAAAALGVQQDATTEAAMSDIRVQPVVEVSRSSRASPAAAATAAVSSRSDRKSATIKLSAFTGTNVPLETHLAKLRNCAEYYGWNSADVSCHLKASLEGPAATLLWELAPDCSEDEVLQLLRSRFGNQEQIERFRFELKTRRRKPSESLQSLYHDVCRLLALAYPGETGSLSQLVARNAFLDSLGDPEMTVKILERGANTVAEAYTIAARHEAYVAASTTSSLDPLDDVNRRRVRAVESSRDQSSTSQRLASIEKAIDMLSSRLQQLPQPVAPAASSYAVGAPPAEMTSSRPRGPPRQPRLCYTCQSPQHVYRNCPENSRAVSNDGAALSSQPPPAANARGVMPPTARDALLPIRLKKKGGNVVNIFALLDSGCNYSTLPKKYCFGRIVPTDVKLHTATGELVPILGKARIQFYVGGQFIRLDCLISELVDEFLLGIDFLQAQKSQWDFVTSVVTINGEVIKLHHREASTAVRRIYVADNILVEAHSVANVPVSLKLTNFDTPLCDVLLEPRTINGCLFVPRMLLPAGSEAVIRVLNISSDPISLRCGSAVGNAEGVRVSSDRLLTPAGAAPTLPCGRQNDNGTDSALSTSDRKLVQSVLDTLPTCVTADQRARIEQLLATNNNLFARHDYDCGKTDLMKCKLELVDAATEPVCQSLRRHAVSQLDIIDNEVNTLLNHGIISRSNSQWASNVVLVKKRCSPGGLILPDIA